MNRKIILVTIVTLTIIALLIFIVKYNWKNNNEILKVQGKLENLSNVNIGNATKIICENIYRENDKEKEDTYNIINKEKISKVKELLETQELKELYDDETSKENYIEIKIYNNEGEKQLTVYENNSIKLNEQEYQVNSDLYKNLVSILNPTYYLHDSNLELPNQENCMKMKEKALNKLDENEISEISRKLREAHTTMEFLLMNGTKNLKQSNSIYWNLYNEAEVITEETGEELEFSKDSCFRAVANNIIAIENILNDEEIKEEFNSIYNRLNKAIENKDLAEMFNIHKEIHDYDYWIINYPTHYDSAPAPDWEGIETYYGTII